MTMTTEKAVKVGVISCLSFTGFLTMLYPPTNAPKNDNIEAAPTEAMKKVQATL